MWGRVVVSAYERHDADSVVAEVNFGGAMVEQVVQAAASEARMRIRFKEVRAARGKVVRAEPVAALYDTGRVHHVGSYQELEDELIAFTTAGYMGDGSPDRADALVWGLTELFPRVIRKDASSFASHSGWTRPEVQTWPRAQETTSASCRHAHACPARCSQLDLHVFPVSLGAWRNAGGIVRLSSK